MKKIPYLITFITFILTLTACNTKDNDNALSFYGDVYQNSQYTSSNYSSFFHTKPVFNEEGKVQGNELYTSYKTEISSKKIPALPTIFNRSIRRIFATQKYLYLISDVVTYTKIERIDLSDYSTEILYEDRVKAKKIVFGLSFSFEHLEIAQGVNPASVFSNDRDVFFVDYDKGIFKVLPDKSAKNIISDKTEHDIAYDGNYIFYITKNGVLKQYDIKNERTEILSDTVTPYTLKVTKDDIIFESNGEIITLKR